MKRVLANDGINPIGKSLLEAAGFEVVTEKIAQENLATGLQDFDVLCVRSATKLRKDLIDACPNLKLVVRGGVGMDNIDVEYARSKGIAVANTPASSSQAVAELVIGQLFTMARFLHDANRKMPQEGAINFNTLKKSYEKGSELRGKTLGIVGFGRIGQAAAKMALGLGMKVIATDPYVQDTVLKMDIAGQNIAVRIETVPLQTVIAQADFITIHVPGGKLIGEAEINQMKKGVSLVNLSRGGVIDEAALLAGLESGHIAAAALDVFENEPTPRQDLLNHPRISLTPHIGASTVEAQVNISAEIAQIIIDFYK